jgi:ABC-type nitrate/sulfonate/bicarbonate transport system substrate-binding protein
MRNSFIESNRAALVDFMGDVLRIERWYLDPLNHDEFRQIAARLLKAPADRLGWIFTNQDYFRDPNGMPDLQALQSHIDAFADLGFIKSGIVVSQYADLSIVEEAAARFK